MHGSNSDFGSRKRLGLAEVSPNRADKIGWSSRPNHVIHKPSDFDLKSKLSKTWRNMGLLYQTPKGWWVGRKNSGRAENTLLARQNQILRGEEKHSSPRSFLHWHGVIDVDQK
jgi:hypothetical protein